MYVLVACPDLPSAERIEQLLVELGPEGCHVSIEDDHGEELHQTTAKSGS